MSVFLRKIEKILKQHRFLFLIAWYLKNFIKTILNCKYARVVFLENSMLEPSFLNKMLYEPDFNSVVYDLEIFTGLSKEQVGDRLRRTPRTHFISEFKWHSPKDKNELAWFYRCSYGYLFANAAHPYNRKLDFLNPQVGRVLDYGAGVGNNVITLAERHFEVDYFEINCIQEAFIRFRISSRGLSGITFISPFFNNKFDPIRCITNTYGAIILLDVLEHVPNYHILLYHLIEHLKTGGYIIEQSPFSLTSRNIDVHLKASMELKEAMKGMECIDKGIWKKL